MTWLTLSSPASPLPSRSPLLILYFPAPAATVEAPPRSSGRRPSRTSRPTPLPEAPQEHPPPPPAPRPRRRPFRHRPAPAHGPVRLRAAPRPHDRPLSFHVRRGITKSPARPNAPARRRHDQAKAFVDLPASRAYSTAAAATRPWSSPRLRGRGPPAARPTMLPPQGRHRRHRFHRHAHLLFDEAMKLAMANSAAACTSRAPPPRPSRASTTARPSPSSSGPTAVSPTPVRSSSPGRTMSSSFTAGQPETTTAGIAPSAPNAAFDKPANSASSLGLQSTDKQAHDVDVELSIDRQVAASARSLPRPRPRSPPRNRHRRRSRRRPERADHPRPRAASSSRWSAPSPARHHPHPQAR